MYIEKGKITLARMIMDLAKNQRRFLIEDVKQLPGYKSTSAYEIMVAMLDDGCIRRERIDGRGNSYSYHYVRNALIVCRSKERAEKVQMMSKEEHRIRDAFNAMCRMSMH